MGMKSLIGGWSKRRSEKSREIENKKKFHEEKCCFCDFVQINRKAISEFVLTCPKCFETEKVSELHPGYFLLKCSCCTWKIDFMVGGYEEFKDK